MVRYGWYVSIVFSVTANRRVRHVQKIRFISIDLCGGIRHSGLCWVIFVLVCGKTINRQLRR
ncbi:hypothetical protein MIDIC_540011 [Alphaproteobacteria bacterium]